MSESGMRGNVTKTLRSLGLDPIAVENPIFPGTPDVNYVQGWIELKWLRNWPKRATSPVVLKEYSQEQRLWIRRRTMAGGKCFLLVQCKREWLLFTHPVTWDMDTYTKAQMIEKAVKYWDKGINKEELKCLLT